MPQGPRATPGKPQEWGQDMRPQPAPASSPNTFMQNTQRRSERSQEPSRLWSSAGSLSPALGHRGSAPSGGREPHATTRHDLGHCSSGSASSSSKDTTPEEATSEACRCRSQLPTGGGQRGWQSLQGAGSSSAGERQDSMRGEL